MGKPSVMLVREEPDGSWVAIGQAAHARVSGQLGRAWGTGRYPGPGEEAAEQVLLAAEQHDTGMAGWDAEPELNPETGRPFSFTELPLATHLALWRAGPRRVLQQSRHAALLVARHGAGLYAHRADEDEVGSFLAEQHAFADGLAASLGLSDEEIAGQSRLLWTWDGLSLAVLLDWAPWTAKGVPGAEGPVDLRLDADGLLDPWPFAADAVTVRCDGRRLEGRFGDRKAMRAALHRAPWVDLAFTLRQA